MGGLFDAAATNWILGKSRQQRTIIHFHESAMRCHVLFVAVLLTAACQAPYTIERAEQPSSVFIEEYMKTKGITEATHGSPHDIAFFTTADTPTAIPDRSTVWHGSGLKLVVAHSLGYSTVEPLYELNAHRRYSQNGRGPDIPIAVRVNPPSHYSAKLTRSSYRQLELDQEYKLTNPFLYKHNTETIIALSREVLVKTHCRGGVVTDEKNAPDFAESYNKRSKAPSGLSINPGWVVKFRCSRWRLN